MKKVLFIILLTSAFVWAKEAKEYGAKLTLKDTTKISSILQNPEKFVTKTVQVKGRVIDVCKKQSCWMKLASEDGSETLLIKVNDGEIVFPLEALGKMATVEGEIQKIELTMEQTIDQVKHECEEEGKEFNEADVKSPASTYRLKAVGAVIEE